MKINTRLLLLAITLHVTTFIATAQIHPVSTWGTGGSGTANCTSSSARHISSTEFYTCGTFSGTVDLNPDAGIQNVTSTNTSGFVTKYDVQTGYLWGVTFQNAIPKKIMHTYDAVYVAGNFSGSASFDNTSYMSNGMSDVFLVKLDFSGGVDWVRTFGGTGEDLCESMDLGVSATGLDVIYLTGTFTNTVDFNPTSGIFNGTSNGETDCFVEKILADGSFGWSRTFGGPKEDNARDIDVFNASSVDDIHIIGDFSDFVDFNPTQGIFYMFTGSSSLSKAIFILKLDESGNFVWAKKIDNTSNSGGFPTYGYSIASDDYDGSVYCGGVFQSSTPYDFDPNAGQFLVTGSGAASNGFLLKLEQNGQFDWVRAFEPSATECVPYDIAVLGSTSSDIFTVGYFLGQCNFNLDSGPLGVLYSSSSNCFVTRHKGNGDFKWAKQPQPGPGQSGTSIFAKHSIEVFEHAGYGKIWFTGAFTSPSVDMHPEVSTEILNNNGVGTQDGFVTQWNESLFGKGFRKSLGQDDAQNNFYPNPTNGVVYFKFGEKELSSIETSNSQGEIINAEVRFENGTCQIDLSNQATGVYLIKYVLDGQSLVERVSLLE